MITKKRVFKPRWSIDEDQAIRDNYPSLTGPQICLLLPLRSQRQISDRASTLGVTKVANYSRAMPSNTGLFTEAQDNIIRNNYPLTPNKIILALMPGIKDYQLKNRAAKLGIKKIYTQNPPPVPIAKFTKEEVEKLKEVYAKLPSYKLIKLFPNHTKEQLRAKAQRMGIKKEEGLKQLTIKSETSIKKDEKPKEVKRFSIKETYKGNPVKIGDMANTIIYAKEGADHDTVRSNYHTQRHAALKNFSRWD